MTNRQADAVNGTGPRKKIILAEPRGFCAGVRRAITIVEKTLEQYGPPVYVRKEIVHNAQVVRALRERGARFVQSENDVPDGAVCVFSAHGVSPQVRRNAAERNLRVIDATCPLVAKVHQEARRFARDGRSIVLIGHREHEEVDGTQGEAPERTWIVETPEDVTELPLPADVPVAYLSQTTLSVDETADVVESLNEHFDDVRGPGTDDICYASQNRQNAIKAMSAQCDVILVVGAANSSNSNRMVEVSRAHGTPAHLLDDAGCLDPMWLDDVTTVGVSSGASAPEHLVEELLERLARYGFSDVETERVATEDLVFLPPSTSPRS